MDDNGFFVVEFIDGLQIIPKKWFNEKEQSCIWPTNYKTKFRINKAIMTCEMPQKLSDWECLPIKRVFGKASDTYTNALEKLILAQDTSNIDDTGVSSDELRQQAKKRRRIKTKKTINSSSSDFSDKDLCMNDDIERRKIQHKVVTVNKVPSFPELRHFVPSSSKMIDKSLQNIQNVSNKKASVNIMNITDINRTNINDREESFVEEHIRINERENIYDAGRKAANPAFAVDAVDAEDEVDAEDAME
ncbi:PREDICTED: uncharacterized protein LOC105449767 [Wasmannia auropunctata]|uniref:uncharacterized protein LOC105449767 n=1 Tax=Wasmannia auropunctata TaxID=64793 RepID=UPI0005F0C1BE|nr:PREDICTED: uncharacterized protein LOC105449767 [Wasmannia auropunctata]